MSHHEPNPTAARESSPRQPGPSATAQRADGPGNAHRPPGASDAVRDIAEVPAVEIITTVALHLMSAAAVKCGLGEEGPESMDLDEARKLINALAGLVVTAAPDLGTFHAGPLRDGLRSLQLAFREASSHPDPPGQGPGEKLTGPPSGSAMNRPR